MDKSLGKPVVTWLILVYDRTAKCRFPLGRKWYVFNSERAKPSEVETVLRLVGYQENPTEPQEPPAIGETRVSMSLGGGVCTSRKILKYRHLFDFVPEGPDAFGDLDGISAFLSVSLPADTYFEDENEHPITLIEIFDEEARRGGGDGAVAILYDHPESILRLGPATPIRADLWTANDADLVSHLGGIYHLLIRSRWLRSKCVVAPIGPDKCDAELPVHEDCMAVILPFRQLYSKDGADDLFNRVCNLHKRHCPKDHPTYGWVAHYQKHFNTLLEQPLSFPPGQTDIPARRYLDAFAYGARVVHASSNSPNPSTDLESLLRGRQREIVVMGYHYILRQLLACVSQTVQVIGQNVNHWVKDHGFAASKLVPGRSLFEAYDQP